ncbi:MAG: histidine--tRNA ligase [Myxococcota bacterium]|nr:histidine--tRNA ligase [Myxococcota bacterium]
MSLIKPTLPRGFRDYLPAEMIPRLQMLTTIRTVFERFGFDPLDTSAIERWEVLGVEEDGSKQVYCAARPEQLLSAADAMDPGQRTLRFDLTVSLARCVAAHWHTGKISKPFKRWQSGRVWRGENTQKGRYREFMQFDADFVGSSSMDADATIIWMMAETLRALNVGGFTISVNNRKLLNGLPALVGFDASRITEVLIILDKQDKIGAEKVRAELARSIGLTEAQIATIATFQALSGDHPAELLDQAEALFAGIEIAQTGISELRQITEYLTAVGLTEWTIDFGIARGLGYYTGPVFETLLHELPSIGSVMSGGRYDGLISGFVKNDLPAVGASIGLDRLFAALDELNRLPSMKTVTAVTVLPESPDQRLDALHLLRILQDAGLNSEIYAGDQRKFGKKLRDIDNKGVPFVVIIGAQEAEAGTAKIRPLFDRSITDVVLTHGEVAAHILSTMP